MNLLEILFYTFTDKAENIQGIMFCESYISVYGNKNIQNKEACIVFTVRGFKIVPSASPCPLSILIVPIFCMLLLFPNRKATNNIRCMITLTCHIDVTYWVSTCVGSCCTITFTYRKCSTIAVDKVLYRSRKNKMIIDPWRGRLIDCPNTSVRNYSYLLCNNPEERSSQYYFSHKNVSNSKNKNNT